MKITVLFLVTTGVVLSASLQAQSTTDPDRAFLEKAAQANLAEIATGRLAAQRSGNPEIQAFGDRMQQDHGKVLQELQGLAAAKGVTLPAAPDEARQATAFKLSRASGREFDLMYVKGPGVADHKAALALFEAGAKSQDPEIAALAKKTLPDIRHHLQMAQQLSGKP
jgi:putative membrane protein